MADEPRDETGRPRRSAERSDRSGRPPRSGERPRREGERPRREGDKPRRDGERPRRDSERPRRDGERPRRFEAGKNPRGDRASAGRGRPGKEDRPRHDDPPIPETVTPQDLAPGARNQLKTLSKENAEQVARHLAMSAALIDEDAALAHRHALAAARRAGRIAVVRETVAITAYATGDFALALRELRTYRRLSGKNDQIALLVDSERGVGRPERALEEGRAVDRSELSADVRAELAIAMSGARLDLGQPERALLELDIPELDPDRAFLWSPALFAARANVLEDLGRLDEAARWRARAEVAERALGDAAGEAAASDDLIEIEELDDLDESSVDESTAAGTDVEEPS